MCALPTPRTGILASVSRNFAETGMAQMAYYVLAGDRRQARADLVAKGIREGDDMAQRRDNDWLLTEQ